MHVFQIIFELCQTVSITSSVTCHGLVNFPCGCHWLLSPPRIKNNVRRAQFCNLFYLFVSCLYKTQNYTVNMLQHCSQLF